MWYCFCTLIGGSGQTRGNCLCFRNSKHILLMRPHQWLKNGFVLVGMLFAHEWAHTEIISSVLIAAASFCLASSTVYVLNDIVDAEADRLHPTKKNRPIAAGQVKPFAAWIQVLICLSAAIGLSLTQKKRGPER